MMTRLTCVLGLVFCISLAGPWSPASEQTATNRVADAVITGLTRAAKDPSDLERKVLAGVLYHAGRYDEALVSLRAMSDKSEDSDRRLMVARVLLALGRVEDGITQLEDLAKQDGKNGKPLYEIGMALITSGDRQKGLMYLRRAIAADPQLMEAHYELALNSTDRAEARRACGRVVVLSERGSERAVKAIELLGTRLKDVD